MSENENDNEKGGEDKPAFDFSGLRKTEPDQPSRTVSPLESSAKVQDEKRNDEESTSSASKKPLVDALGFQSDPDEDVPARRSSRRASASASPDIEAPETERQSTPKEATERESGRERRGIQIGILGAKGTGKTFLFYGMLHRTASGDQSGALTFFFKGGRNVLSKANIDADSGRPTGWRTEEPHKTLDNYLRWKQVEFTVEATEAWYDLEIHYRAGFRWNRRRLDVRFLDASGEALKRGPIGKRQLLWKEAYIDADLIIFCIPFWVVFPDYESPGLEDRERILEESRTVFGHYDAMMEDLQRRGKVTPILALTMADDRRCDFSDLRTHWILAYTEDEERYKRHFRRQGVVTSYLSQARAVSDFLADRLTYGGADINWILPGLDLVGKTRPWIVPVSACDGAYLETRIREQQEAKRDARASAYQRGPEKHPIPAHVELPILLALCEDSNALI